MVKREQRSTHGIFFLNNTVYIDVNISILSSSNLHCFLATHKPWRNCDFFFLIILQFWEVVWVLRHIRTGDLQWKSGRLQYVCTWSRNLFLSIYLTCFVFLKFVKLGHLSMNWKQIKESRKVFLIYVVCYKFISGIMVYCMTTNVCMLFTISSEG